MNLQGFSATQFLFICALSVFCAALLAVKSRNPLLPWVQVGGTLIVVAEDFLPLGHVGVDNASLFEIVLARCGSLVLIFGAMAIGKAKKPAWLVTAYQSAIIYLVALAILDLSFRVVLDTTGTDPLNISWCITIFGMTFLTAAALELRRFSHKEPLKWLRIILTASYFAVGCTFLVSLALFSSPLYGAMEDQHGPAIFNTLALTYLAPSLLLGLVAWKAVSLPRLASTLSMFGALALGGLWVGMEIAYQRFGGNLSIGAIEVNYVETKRGIGREVLVELPEFKEAVRDLGLENATESNLLRIIDSGNARHAAWHLGKMYRTGDGVQQDGDTAAYWLRLAAEAGHASAGHDAGELYMNGVLVPVDYGEALRFFQMAGDEWGPSQLLIGDIFAQGLGVAKDPEAARYHYCFATQDPNSMRDAHERFGRILPHGPLGYADYGPFEQAKCGDVIALIRGKEAARVQAYRLNKAREGISRLVWSYAGLTASLAGFMVGWRRKESGDFRNPTVWLLSMPSLFLLTWSLHGIYRTRTYGSGDSYTDPLVIAVLTVLIVFVAGPLAMFPYFAYRRKVADNTERNDSD